MCVCCCFLGECAHGGALPILITACCTIPMLQNKVKTKKLYMMLSVILMLSFVTSMFALPNANAQTERVTYPFVDSVPRMAGAGQTVLINFGLLNFLSQPTDGWNMTLTIIDPDGKVETVNRMTWATGSVGYSYTPTKVGNYTLQSSFENVTYRNVRYASSVSENFTLQIVEGYFKPTHPGHTLPTEYWSRPVDSQLREWYSIMGSWFAQKQRNGNLFAPYNEAPTTAHILWSTPDMQYTGGLAGGDMGAGGFQHGDAYEGKFYGACIIAGVLYYNVAPVSSGAANMANQTLRALDLHTGQELWSLDLAKLFGTTARLTRGQILMFMSANNRGAWAYLWVQNGATGTSWYAIDPLTGRHVYTMTGFHAPSAGGLSGGTKVYYGPNGEMLTYQIVTNATGAYLRQWNSTLVVQGTSGQDAWGSKVSQVGAARVFAANTAANLGYSTKDDILLARNFGATGVNGVNSNPMGNPIQVFPLDRAIFATTNASGTYLSAVSLDLENWGMRLFTDRHTPAPDNWASLTGTVTGDSNGQSGWACFSDDPYVGVFWTKEDRVNHVFSLDTGRLLYRTEPQHFADGWGGVQSNSAPEKVIAYGRLIEGSGGGTVVCYNATTGDLLWSYEARDPYIGESYITENWYAVLCFVSDSKVYFGHSHHSAQEPKPRGAPFYALDVETGDLVWRIDGAFRQHAWGGRAIIGDSIIATLDTYDSQIYGIGKGPSEVTVSISNPVVTAGTPVLISGTAMDISPGLDKDVTQRRFPKGVPAVADESMSEWMLYVWKNFERPMDTKGVEITLFGVGKNNESFEIGTVVSDVNGRFSYTWTPNNSEDVDVYATFNGSGAYFGSWAKTEMTVLDAPEVVDPDPLPPYGIYIALAAVAIIIAVVIVGLLLFRKIGGK